jgi:hypothetical protein
LQGKNIEFRCFAAHTERCTMINDVWRQWQTMIAGGLGASPAFQARGAREGASGLGAAAAPFLDAAERYAAAARSFVDSAAAPGAAAPPADAAARFSEFLREQFADFQMPWSAGVGASQAFSFDAPALGAARERQLRLQRMGNASLRIEEAQRRLQRLWSDALRDAANAFAARCMPSLTPNSEDLHKLYDAWIDCAEEAYARTARSEAFCSALAELVNAGSAWRRELQADVEQWAKLLDLPTRAEINTLVRRLKAAEEQLRAARAESRPPLDTPAPGAAERAPTAPRKAAMRARAAAPAAAAKTPSRRAKRARARPKS